MLQVGVKILLFNEEGKCLLLKRNKEKYPEVRHLWDIPGGRIQPGIELRENLRREVFEETGMVLSLSTVTILDAQDILLKDKHVVRITYMGSATGNPQLSEEHVDFAWFTLHELSTLEGLDNYFSTLLANKKEAIEQIIQTSIVHIYS